MKCATPSQVDCPLGLLHSLSHLSCLRGVSVLAMSRADCSRVGECNMQCRLFMVIGRGGLYD